jgi:hypothetical protein
MLSRDEGVLGVTAALHAACQAWGMAHAPQLYANSFYARGAALRTLQILVTDVLGSNGVAVLAAALLAAFVAGLPRAPALCICRLRVFARAVSHRMPRVMATAMVVPAIGLCATYVARRSTRGDPSSEASGALASRAMRYSSRPNVLVIAVTSLRADRLTPAIAPRLSALAKSGSRFERAFVSMPSTLPSLVTLFTGRTADHHGVRTMFPSYAACAKNFDALPARLSNAGYVTRVVSDDVDDTFARIDLGFDNVDAKSRGARRSIRERELARAMLFLPFLQSRAGRAFFPALRGIKGGSDPSTLATDARSALASLAEARRKGPAPFFLTVVFSAASDPYAVPAPYYARFSDKTYRGRFKYDFDSSLNSSLALDAKDIAQVRALYNGAVASIDAAVGQILDALVDEGQGGNTIVILTGVHGESLFENGHGQGHGNHLFGDEGVHVPLLKLWRSRSLANCARRRRRGNALRTASGRPASRSRRSVSRSRARRHANGEYLGVRGDGYLAR